MAPDPRAILLTGGSGFVGALLRRSLAVAFPSTRLLTPVLDIRDHTAVTALIAAETPDVVVHLAAISTVAAARAREDEAWRINLLGTLALARAMRAHTPTATLVFASSAEAYGASFRAGVPITEDAPLAPMTIYGATKAAADLALGAMAETGLSVVRVRAFNHTGPGQTPAFVVPAFAQRVARIALGLAPPILRVGNLDARRDFLDARDVCDGYIGLIRHRDTLPAGIALNFASGQPRRIGDMLTAMVALAGINPTIEVDPALLRSTDLPITHGDTTRARHLLGWEPRVPWEDTLRAVLDDWLARERT
jgi:GDP-4-dehydro-6-deoxy-D-mannose reductase